MPEPPRWPQSARAMLTAAGIVGLVGSIWAFGAFVGVVGVPACTATDRRSCGFVLVALVVGAVAVFVIAAGATAAIVTIGRGITRAQQLRRYGRWLSLREARRASGTPTETAVRVDYHDATGGPLSGVEIAYEVVGINPGAAPVARSTVITDSDGSAVIPVHVRYAPSIITIKATVPANPGIKGVGGVFVIGVG